VKIIVTVFAVAAALVVIWAVLWILGTRQER
jgi:ABC-type transporter Mla subunit MlaD